MNARGASRRRAAGGFTLIEVVLAAAIMGVCLAVLMTAAMRCLAILTLAKNYQKAQWALGRGEVEHPLFVTNDLEKLNVAAETYENGVTFERTVEEEDEDEDDLYLVTTRVSWGDDGESSADEIVQLIYHPEDKTGAKKKY